MPLILSGCISEYIPRGTEEIWGVLVVDGVITNRESVFTLRKSVGITAELKDEETVDNAFLFVECSNGSIFAGEFIEKGKYVVLTGELDPQLGYRLSFAFDGKVYQSDFLSPIISSKIDSITYTKEKERESIYVRVSAHDPRKDLPYYRWTYIETWEVKSELLASLGYMDGELVNFNINTPVNTYYCWGRKESNAILLESTEKLSENVVCEKRLIEIPYSHDKLSILYHVEVNQIQIRKEAYEYFAVLRNTTERPGGLFSPVLSTGIKGNIRCLADPDIPVVGFIEVTTTSKKTLFIDGKDLHKPPKTYCPLFDAIQFAGLPYVSWGSVSYANCVDCRVRENSSKDKPDWWPTNHL